MLAVDTNILVRYLTNDHPQQSRRAQRLVDTNDVWVPLTVLLETEWVLRSVYRHTPAAIAHALRGFAGMPGVTLENATVAAQALNWLDQGVDFADALHLAGAGACEAFATFDAALAKAARRVGAIPVRVP